MAKKAWSDPEKSSKMLSKIPMGRFAGWWKSINISQYLIEIISKMLVLLLHFS